MGDRSNAYAELGGGLGALETRTSRPATVAAPPVHRHRFDAVSGWCGCGRRDDGEIAEYSPMWRARKGQDA